MVLAHALWTAAAATLIVKPVQFPESRVVIGEGGPVLDLILDLSLGLVSLIFIVAILDEVVDFAPVRACKTVGLAEQAAILRTGSRISKFISVILPVLVR